MEYSDQNIGEPTNNFAEIMALQKEIALARDLNIQFLIMKETRIIINKLIIIKTMNGDFNSLSNN